MIGNNLQIVRKLKCWLIISMHCIRIFRKYVNSFNFNNQTLIMKMIRDKHWKSTNLWTKKNIKNICFKNIIEKPITFVEMKMKNTIRNTDNNNHKFYWISSKMIMKFKKSWNRAKQIWIIFQKPTKKIKKI
jgi:hypothetical protein